MRIPITVGCLVVLISTFAGGRSIAQSADNKEGAPARACTDMNFLAGDWAVRGVDGTSDATVRVRLGGGKCYATEFWRFSQALGGGQGTCLSAYSNQKHNWTHICGVGNGDRFHFADGKSYGNEVRFVGMDLPDGVAQTFTLSSLPDGRIHELVKESSDAGKTWKTLADEYWSRKK
jgi:hypothetical protein